MLSVFLWCFVFAITFVYMEFHLKNHPKVTRQIVVMSRLGFGAVGFLFLLNWL